MNFKVRKIKNKRKKKGLKRFTSWLHLGVFFGPRGSKVVVILLFLLLLLGGGYGLVKSGIFHHTVKRTLTMGGLDKDAYGHTNILFLGVGGTLEEGGNLSDSVMLVSIQAEKGSASVLSLPRDLFVSSGDPEVGDRKLNEVYARARYKYGDKKGLDIAKQAVSNFTGVEVHYATVVSFDVFRDAVNAFGGVDIFVPEDIVDPFYPDGNYGYETFVVRKGFQRFDGDMALKYARSRKTSSDYDRAKRQQDLVMALRKKAEKLNLFKDFGKIRDLYQTFRTRVNTDMGITDLIELAKIGITLDFEDVIMAVLNDDPTQKGGFLYTPAKEFFGGQFVLLPQDLKDTQHFIHLVLIEPGILLENAQISVLNGSNIEGKASESAARLRRMGFHVIDIGNYPTDRPVFQTFLKDLKGGITPRTLEFLKSLFEINEVLHVPSEDLSADEQLVDLKIILGIN